MANAIYPKFKELLLTYPWTGVGGAPAPFGPVNVALISFTKGTGYTYNAAHEFFDTEVGDDVTGAVYGVGGVGILPLQNPTASATGVADADNRTYTALAADGAFTVDAVILYIDGAVPGTDDWLVAYFDQDLVGSPNFPYTPTGIDLVIQWNASGVFAL